VALTSRRRSDCLGEMGDPVKSASRSLRQWPRWTSSPCPKGRIEERQPGRPCLLQCCLDRDLDPCLTRPESRDRTPLIRKRPDGFGSVWLSSSWGSGISFMWSEQSARLLI